jgi:LCP family protein required for cell wall assembly
MLGLLLPGAGHWYLGRRRTALAFLAPIGLLLLAAVVLLALNGWNAIAALLVPGVLPALLAINLALAAWRIAAALDAARGIAWTRAAGGALGSAIVLLVVVPHLVAGQSIGSLNEFLDSTFANRPGESPAPVPTTAPTEAAVSIPPTAAPTPTPAPSPSPSPEPSPSVSPDPSPTAAATPAGSGGTATARPPIDPGTGSLPALGASIPWKAPGEVPWGSDGRFTLLLLGSDAGPGRWSRRMDSMILVEVEVATGRMAMVGIPRNMTNAPFPPGPARDAVACGCLTGLLNELYVEATERHPGRWPGSGVIRGIAAVRAVLSELTGKPIDAVLVVDMVGMIRVVDAMGGIDITIPARVRDVQYDDPLRGVMTVDIAAGKHHFDGATALFYARTRHQDSDYFRMARQQTLLLAIRSQIGASTVLGAGDLFDAAKGFVWTDLPRSSLPNLAQLFGKAKTAAVKQVRIIPPTYPSKLTPSWILKIRADIAALLGSAPPPPPSPTPAPTPAPTPTPGPTPDPDPSPDPT